MKRIVVVVDVGPTKFRPINMKIKYFEIVFVLIFIIVISGLNLIGTL
jgi:thiosulfate reductase cytochrome b subunit